MQAYVYAPEPAPWGEGPLPGDEAPEAAPASHVHVISMDSEEDETDETLTPARPREVMA